MLLTKNIESRSINNIGTSIFCSVIEGVTIQSGPMVRNPPMNRAPANNGAWSKRKKKKSFSRRRWGQPLGPVSLGFFSSLLSLSVSKVTSEMFYTFIGIFVFGSWVESICQKKKTDVKW